MATINLSKYGTPLPVKGKSSRTIVMDPWLPFEDEAGGTWIVLDGRRVPKFCDLCGGTFIKGDTLYLRRRMAWMAMCFGCLSDIMIGAPKESFTTIRARLVAGGPLFV